MVQRSPTLARQAATEVVRAIRAGELAGADGLLPSETALSQRLGVSRATLREALSHLERSGVILRRHGVGTFVTGQALVESGLEELESIEKLAARRGIETHMGSCLIEELEAAPEEAEALDVPAGSPVIAVERVMLTGTTPVAYLVDVVPADVLSRADLGSTFHGSVLDLILERGEPELSHSSTEISAEAAGRELAERLETQVGDPVLRLTAQLFAKSGRVVDHSRSYFSPGFIHFHVIRRVTPLTFSSMESEPARME
jgi:GntR family transcriptional regulator